MLDGTRAAVSLLLGMVVACQLPGPPNASQGPMLEGVPQRYTSALEALRQSVLAHEDAQARRISRNLRWRLGVDPRPASTGSALQLLDAFDLVLDGRELVRELRFWLAVEVDESEQLARVELRACSDAGIPLVLVSDAVTLRAVRTVLFPSGEETGSSHASPASVARRIVLPPGEEVRIPLQESSILIPATALACRLSWSLRFHPGSLEADGALYPAAMVVVEDVERVQLAAFLPNTPVPLAVLLEACRDVEVSLPAVLERAVRLEPAQGERALDELGQHLLYGTPEQITRLVPVLRWLSGEVGAARDPEAWRAWLRSRSEAGSSSTRPALDF